MPAPLDFNALVNAVGDAVVVCDASGLITFWNPAAEHMFGFTQAEALGQSLDIIIPERMRKRHWDGYHKTMASGVTKYGHDVLRVPAIGKGGKSLSIAFTVGLLYAPDGKVASIASVMRDDTEAFNRERAMRKRITELESRVAGIATSATEAPPSR